MNDGAFLTNATASNGRSYVVSGCARYPEAKPAELRRALDVDQRETAALTRAKFTLQR